MKKLIIAIDGTAGSGKSTTAKALAAKLGLLSIDSGALYRAVTLKAIREGVPPEDGEALEELASKVDLDQRMKDSEVRTYMDGEDVSDAIRSHEVSKRVPMVSRHPGVRRQLVKIQRRLAKAGGAVIEGRDIGTVVFPDADLKVFMTASPEVRAERRRKELGERGAKLSLEEVLQEITERDKADTEREVSPLRKADDAFVVDTSHLSVDEQVEVILREIERRFGEVGG